MEYLIHILILISIFSILGITLDLVVGYTGQLAINQSVFYGIGAYSTAILATTFEINFFWTIIFGILLSATVSFLVGIILNRFSGDIYALVSFGFAIIMHAVFLNWQTLTNGPLGISGIGRPEIFGFVFSENLFFLFLSIFFLFVVYFLCKILVNSSFGRALKVVREDELVSQIFGYKPVNYKLVIFIISSSLASISGALFASYVSFIDPSSFILLESIFILTIIIVGGISNIRGAILGAIILIFLPEAIRFIDLPADIAAQSRQIIYGILLLVMMYFRPKGFLGKFRI